VSNLDKPSGSVHAELVAERHQRFLASQGLRTSQGSFYTPLDVVERFVTLALESKLNEVVSAPKCLTVIDPACGTGNFLIVAALQLADRLIELGCDPHTAIDHVTEHCIFGIDIDVDALDHCASNLSLLTQSRVSSALIRKHLVRANALTTRSAAAPMQLGLNLADDSPRNWLDLFPDVFSGEAPGFDLVIGNPPFLNQLSDATKLQPSISAEIASTHGAMASKMSNPSTVFVLTAIDLAKSSGVIALIQPLSFLATDDADAARSLLTSSNAVDYLWVCTEKIFDADTFVCGIVARMGSSAPVETTIVTGRGLALSTERVALNKTQGTWSIALTASKGFPRIELVTRGVLGSHCVVSSDFRDQYYGLIDCVSEEEVVAAGLPRLATVGLIDPGEFLWGQTSTKFAKHTYQRPVVAIDRLTPEMKSWAKSKLTPKILVAAQTRVIEAWVDIDGNTLPSVPLMTVLASDRDIWKVAAVLCAPPISLHAAELYLGAGLSPDALRLSGRSLLSLPLPADEDAWEIGARKLQLMHALPAGSSRRDALIDFGEAMCRAYGVPPDKIMLWWIGRLPRR
jgi:methylase of polypeptide subunit release factors